MLVRCYDGSGVRQLKLMIETQAFEPTFRHDCLRAYHGLALTGQVPIADVVAYAGRLIADIPPDAGYDRWYAWLAIAAAELQAPELHAPIMSLFDRALTAQSDQIFPIIDKDGIDAIYARDATKVRDDILETRFFDEFVEDVSGWYWFHKPRPKLDAAARAYEAHRLDLPYMRTLPKIGRNDPCLCGSGKKYKRCCLN